MKKKKKKQDETRKIKQLISKHLRTLGTRLEEVLSVSTFPFPLVNIIRMKLNEAPPQTVVRMKAVWIWERGREGGRESSCWVSMICRWVSRAICWLSQTAGDYNYPAAEEGAREACSVNRLALLSCMFVAHSQGPHSCTSTALYRMWLFKFAHTWSVLPL